MATFIAYKIMQAKDAGGTAGGQAKYRTYFIKTRLYKAYQGDVDLILSTTDGYDDCIVSA